MLNRIFYFCLVITIIISCDDSNNIAGINTLSYPSSYTYTGVSFNKLDIVVIDDNLNLIPIVDPDGQYDGITDSVTSIIRDISETSLFDSLHIISENMLRLHYRMGFQSDTTINYWIDNGYLFYETGNGAKELGQLLNSDIFSLCLDLILFRPSSPGNNTNPNYGYTINDCGFSDYMSSGGTGSVDLMKYTKGDTIIVWNYSVDYIKD